MMAAMAALDGARAAYARREWGEAHAQFAAADEAAPLAACDLELAARAAELGGDDAAAAAWWTRAVHVAELDGDFERAARCAYWLGASLMQRGELAPAAGWWARAGRLVDQQGGDSVVAGYLLIPPALQALFSGDATTSYPGFVEVLAAGERFADTDLRTLGQLGVGQSLLALGRSADGIATLDEAMVSVTAGEVSPHVAGIVYCSVIEGCYSMLDVRRAREWTEALSRWCDSQPQLVPFRGQCLIHRAELMRLSGAWSAAATETERAYQQLNAPPTHPATANAIYERAELHRLRGELDEADAAYREASRRGREPQPGLARLRLAQGQLAAAEAAIRRVVAEQPVRSDRVQMLAAFVDIMVAIGDVADARGAAMELSTLASEMRASFLDATSAYASGAVALAAGDALGAMGLLRRAWTVWCELDTPYEAARARTLIGLACRELGDADTAAMELDMARRAFAELGAAPDAARLDALVAGATGGGGPGLTGREMEVLELVAAGRTNRQIAQTLVISEKTVARHVSNIFVKLDVSTRAAATAYAFKHGLA
jgi:DNA-binding CsgD family transcriptional regulator/tetratricopeptide (TPR) repeat protein